MSLFKRLKTWYTSQDTQQRINVVTNFFSDSFRVVMATLLSVFVPQNCNGDICNLSQNFTDLISFNVFSLTFNFVTLFCFILLYYIELRREKWMISHFDYEEKEDDLNLTSYRQTHPHVFHVLDKFNKDYFKAYFYLRYLYILNFIFSAILVLYYYYYDYRSATVLLTNVALCWSKIVRGYSLSKLSLENGLAYSFFNIKHLSFNVIDKKLQMRFESVV
jgi:hypothetical protein